MEAVSSTNLLKKVFSPIHIETTSTPATTSNSSQSYSYSANVQLSSVSQAVKNPFNSKSNGFITSTVFGGITGKNVGNMIRMDGSPQSGLKSELSSSQALAFQTIGKNMGIGAGIYGGLSVLKQGVGMAMGTQDAQGAIANIMTDVIGGGAAGLGATVTGGLTGMALKAIGSTGGFGTVLTFIGGMVGASIGSGVIEASGLRDFLVDKFGSKKAELPDTNPPAAQ